MMRRLLGLSMGVFTLAGCGLSAQQPCQFQASRPQPLSGQAGEYRRIQFVYRQSSEYTTDETAFTIEVISWAPGQLQAALVDQPNPESKTYQTIPETARATGATLAFNGGYYDEDFRPLGLYQQKQSPALPMSPSALLSGVLGITPEGDIDLISRDQYQSNTYAEAFQAGPFVIDPGGQMGIRSDDGQQAKRTVVAITPDQQRLAIVTSPVSLYALATCLQTQPQALGITAIDRALNLDGGPSTGLYVDLPNRDLAEPEAAPVRTQVVFHLP